MRDLESLNASWDRFGMFNYLHRVSYARLNTLNEFVPVIVGRRAGVDILRKEHHTVMKKLCEMYNVPFLEYRFDMGWEPFCKFVHKLPPEVPIPHLHKS